MKKVGNSQVLLEDFVLGAHASIKNIKLLICTFFENIILPKLDLNKMIRGNVAKNRHGLPIVKNGLLTPLPDISVKDNIVESGLGHLL